MEEHKIIGKAIENLFSKMLILNTQNLNISEYNKSYIQKYFKSYSYYMSLYSQLFLKTFKKLTKPVSECTFVDYGGGCGMLSYLAKEIGFKTVVYNDINRVSVHDTQIISGSLHIPIDYYISGDAEEFIYKIKLLDIKPDLICSFDVLEHIYNIESCITTLSKINSDFTLLFMTSANPENPFIACRLKKLHIRSEYKEVVNNIRKGDIYINTSFLQERREIIGNKFPELDVREINFLASKSRGLRKDDIEKMVSDYIETGEIVYKINHPTNTCDPYTGSWTEKLIDIKQLKYFIKKINLNVELSNSLYGYSTNKLLNIIKFIVNQLIKLSGPKCLFFSPTFTLEIINHSNKL